MNKQLPLPLRDRAAYVVQIVNPGNGSVRVWNTFTDRAAADAERVKLAKAGLYAMVRRSKP